VLVIGIHVESILLGQLLGSWQLFFVGLYRDDVHSQGMKVHGRGDRTDLHFVCQDSVSPGSHSLWPVDRESVHKQRN